MRNKWLAWSDKAGSYTWGINDVPSEDPNSIYDTVIWYENPWVGVFKMGFWACMLIVQECLQQCGSETNYEGLNQEYVRMIFRSVEHLSKGILGPFRVGFAIRVAYEFADKRAQEWVLGLLAGFSKRYAATTNADYPEPQDNEYGYS